jgi:hypothetical protein
MSWESNTISFEYLQTQAESSVDVGMMIPWLKRIGVMPMNVEWKRSNRIPNTNLNPAAIPVQYLAEFAYEWDSWGGGSTPSQFVKALAFEVRGTKEKAAVGDLIEGLESRYKGGPAS